MHKEEMNMHEIERTELIERSQNIIEVNSIDYRWITPEANNLRVRGIKLEPNNFILKEVSGDFATLTLVEEKGVGNISITEYFCKEDRKLCETFKMQLKFVFDKIILVKFEGNDCAKELANTKFKTKVLPVILFIQNKPENVVKVGQKKNKASKKLNYYEILRTENSIPKNVTFQGKKYSICQPEKIGAYTEEMLRKKGIICIIPDIKTLTWLQKWATKINTQQPIVEMLSSNSQINPFFDKKRDENVKIACIKAQAEGNFMQINLSKIGEQLWQLDYYDQDSDETQMIVLFDNKSQIYDIAYVDGDGKVTEEVNSYALRILNVFISVLVYMRIFSWEDADKENYTCEVTVFPEEMLGRKIELFAV